VPPLSETQTWTADVPEVVQESVDVQSVLPPGMVQFWGLALIIPVWAWANGANKKLPAKQASSSQIRW
jgi:hypothetical protein